MELFGIRKSFSRRNFFGHGGYLEICRVAYPLVIMSASNSIMQFVDRKFLAENSTLDVAASMPAGILYFTLFAFFMSTCNYTSALVAQYHGANDRSSVLHAVWAGQTLAVAAGVIITFLIPPIGRFCILHSGHPAELISRELEYFSSLLPSGVFLCMAAPCFAFFSGQGRTIPVAVINISGCLLNIFLDYIFIFGKCGLPAFGIFGAGIVTSICCFCIMAAAMICFYAQNQRKIPTRKRWEFRPELIGKLIRFGAPAGFQTFIDVGAWTMVSFLIGHLGPAALAASVIALSINNIYFVPLLGLSDSTAIVVGHSRAASISPRSATSASASSPRRRCSTPATASNSSSWAPCAAPETRWRSFCSIPLPRGDCWSPEPSCSPWCSVPPSTWYGPSSRWSASSMR